MTPALTVVLPTLNEAANLERLVPALRQAAAGLGLTVEFIVVDGPSTDGTRDVAARLGARVLIQKGPGYGSALTEGLAAATGDWVLTLDADGSHPPEDLARLWAAREGRDLVIGSRYCAGGGAEMPLQRQVLSRALNIVTRFWVGLDERDSSSGFRLYRGTTARGVAAASEARDFTAQQRILLSVLAGGGRVVELPFRYLPREAGVSKASALRLLPAYGRLLASARPDLLALGVALGVALAIGLCGLGWGLPGPRRLRAFPDALRPSADVARRLTDSWNELYRGIWASHRKLDSEEPVTYARGVETVEPGWTWPPGLLTNSYRSLLLRTRHPDEQKPFVVLAQMRPWRLDFQPLYVQYGGAFIYPLGAFLYGLSLTGATRLVADMSHYLQAPQDMAGLFYGGRLFVLLFHLGTLVILFGLGRRLSGGRAGLAAAALLMVAPFAAAHTHIVKPHAYAAFWALAALAAALAARLDGRRRDYLLSGFCAGMAAGASFSHVPFGLAVPAAWWARRGAAAPAERRRALGGVALAAGVFLAANPYFLFSFKDYLWELTVYPTGGERVPLLAPLASLLGPASLASLGLVPLVAAWAGLLSALRADPARRFLAWTSLAVFVCEYVVLSRSWGWLSGVSAARFFYPFLLLACLWAADFIASRGPLLRVVLLAAALFDAGWRAMPYLENMRLDGTSASTWDRAADWIEAEVPAGASVGLLGYPHPSHTPPFRYDRYRLVVLGGGLEQAKPSELPPILVTDSQHRPAAATLESAGYRLAAEFPAAGRGWARVRDESFYANPPFYVYRRAIGP